MRAKEFISEDSDGHTGSITQDVALALPGAFIRESSETFDQDQRDTIPDMLKYNALDNSNPYAMWRFIVAAAGEPYNKDSFRMAKTGPTGQKFVTVAYSQGDADILNATAKAMGVKGTAVTTKTSCEPPDTDVTSPVIAFKGYRRK